VTDASDADVTRRTHLAAERTWLAWWRTGIATATAAVAVGGVIPKLADVSKTPYVLLGVGYALLSAAVFLAGWRRHRDVAEALDRAGYVPLSHDWVAGLTFAGAVLALGTLAVVIFD
jgi:putative membrane protein